MAGENVKFMELRKVGVAKLISDSVGASMPTYGPLMRLPGALKITVAPKGESKELKGDSLTLDIYYKTDRVELDIEASLLNIESLPIIQGGEVTESGVSPLKKIKYRMRGSDTVPPYFMLDGQWTYVEQGLADAHVVLYKCRVTEFPALEIPDSSGNFGTVKFKAIAVPCICDSNKYWWGIDLNETQQDVV